MNNEVSLIKPVATTNQQNNQSAKRQSLHSCSKPIEPELVIALFDLIESIQAHSWCCNHL
jgi:hypothetical protein